MEVLLASASLRALLFDDSPGPQLIDFMRTHGLEIAVETVSTTSAMLLFSEVTPGHELHLADFIVEILLNQDVRADFKESEPRSFVTVLQETHDVVREIGQKQARWAPISPDYLEKTNSTVGHQPGVGIFQYANITRKTVPLTKWGDEVVGMLGEISIRRRTIITYVANRLGGVHYDSRRFPVKEADAREFRVLAESFDWKQEAVVHAGLVVVFLSCLELVINESICEIHRALNEFHQSRQQRLRDGRKLSEED